jgi:glycosyltransferase involved in cell wall biosynthesis
MPNAQLTVLLATRNGEHVLPRVLDAYCRVAAPAGGWKMVIVDNGSTDSTPQVIDSFRNDLPLQVLQQPHPGKYRALNSAITAIEGGLVVFTDDDSIPDPTFLTAWAKYLIRRDEYELFGGSIEPLLRNRPGRPAPISGRSRYPRPGPAEGQSRRPR